MKGKLYVSGHQTTITRMDGHQYDDRECLSTTFIRVFSSLNSRIFFFFSGWLVAAIYTYTTMHIIESSVAEVV